MTVANWRVRVEDALDAGRAVSLTRLAQGLENGVWGESDQVRGPRDGEWRLIGEHPELEEFLPVKPLFRKRASEEAEMDMTPMIDVTFQLLIFFMIAATYIVQKTLDMPKAEAQEDGASTVTLEELEKNNIMVKLAADRSLTVQGQPTTFENLPQALEAAVKGADTAELVLDASDDVDHESVVKVLDAAASALIEKVHFVQRSGNRGPPAAVP